MARTRRTRARTALPAAIAAFAMIAASCGSDDDAETVAKDGEIAQIATTQAQSVTVTTTLGPEDGAEIEAPGDPFPTPFRIWLWLGVAAGLLLLAGLLVWWWTRRKVLQHSVTVAVPAHVKALRELLRWRSASAVF